MEIPDGKVRILCRKTRLPELPGNAVEKCRITVTAQMCLIETEDAAGLRRAFIHLEENMTAHRYPELAFGTTEDYTFEKMRISRSPLATYRFGGGWELNHEENFYPDAYLNALAHCHVNGIWVAGLFREMIPSAVLPELCTDVEPQALARLNRFDGTGGKVRYRSLSVLYGTARRQTRTTRCSASTLNCAAPSAGKENPVWRLFALSRKRYRIICVKCWSSFGGCPAACGNHPDFRR